MLDLERATYSENAAAWTAQHPGKFAVVKGDNLAGVFDTMDEALAAGARGFGLQPFLVRQLGQPPEQVSIPALAMGLLRARP
jgi:hypothetical protein